jgi:hypothetical protein
MLSDAFRRMAAECTEEEREVLQAALDRLNSGNLPTGWTDRRRELAEEMGHIVVRSNLRTEPPTIHS